MFELSPIIEALQASGHDHTQIQFTCLRVEEFSNLAAKETEPVKTDIQICKNGMIILDAWAGDRWVSVWVCNAGLHENPARNAMEVGTRGAIGVIEQWKREPWRRPLDRVFDWLMQRNPDKT